MATVYAIVLALVLTVFFLVLQGITGKHNYNPPFFVGVSLSGVVFMLGWIFSLIDLEKTLFVETMIATPSVFAAVMLIALFVNLIRDYCFHKKEEKQQ